MARSVALVATILLVSSLCRIAVEAAPGDCVAKPKTTEIAVAVPQLYCGEHCETNAKKFEAYVDVFFREEYNSSAVYDLQQDPYAVFVYGFFRDALAMCSGYVPQISDPSCPFKTLDGAQSHLIVPRPVLSTSNVQVALSNTIFGNNSKEALNNSLYRRTGAVSAVLPVVTTQVSAIDEELNFPIVESPGTSFITLKETPGQATIEAITSPAVVQIILILMAANVAIGILIYIIEMIRSRHTTPLPLNPWHGIPSSVWYTTCSMIDVDFGFQYPRSNSAQVILLLWRYGTYVALALLNAQILLALQPYLGQGGTYLDTSNMHGITVGVISGTSDDLHVAAQGGRVIFYDTTEEAMKALCDRETYKDTKLKPDAIALDSLVVGSTLKQGCKSSGRLLTVGNQLSENSEIGFIISRELARTTAVDLEGTGQTTNMRECIHQMTKVGMYPVRRNLARYVGTIKNDHQNEFRNLNGKVGDVLVWLVPSIMLGTVIIMGIASSLTKRKRRRDETRRIRQSISLALASQGGRLPSRTSRSVQQTELKAKLLESPPEDDLTEDTSLGLSGTHNIGEPEQGSDENVASSSL